jgi:hypothetical protein
MPITIDGLPLGEGKVRIEIKRRALAVMVAKPGKTAAPTPPTIKK